jgi:hypothetical protein
MSATQVVMHAQLCSAAILVLNLVADDGVTGSTKSAKMKRDCVSLRGSGIDKRHD